MENGSSNDGAICYLKRRTKEWKSNVLQNEYIHVRCYAHIMNLIVTEELKDLYDSILRIRYTVRYVR